VSRIWDNPLNTSSLNCMRLPQDCVEPNQVFPSSLYYPGAEEVQPCSFPPHHTAAAGVEVLGHTTGSTLSSSSSTFDSGVVRDEGGVAPSSSSRGYSGSSVVTAVSRGQVHHVDQNLSKQQQHFLDNGHHGDRRCHNRDDQSESRDGHRASGHRGKSCRGSHRHYHRDDQSEVGGAHCEVRSHSSMSRLESERGRDGRWGVDVFDPEASVPGVVVGRGSLNDLSRTGGMREGAGTGSVTSLPTSQHFYNLISQTKAEDSNPRNTYVLSLYQYWPQVHLSLFSRILK